ncbi:MAG: hypothetical protein ABSH29_19275 [Acidimicrobiales bacterium]|jgi:hypothetical protein
MKRRKPRPTKGTGFIPVNARSLGDPPSSEVGTAVVAVVVGQIVVVVVDGAVVVVVD